MLGAALWQIVVVCLLAAVAGDQAGYWLGSRYGRAALVVGRFVPIVRTYVPFAAGAGTRRAEGLDRPHEARGRRESASYPQAVQFSPVSRAFPPVSAREGGRGLT